MISDGAGGARPFEAVLHPLVDHGIWALGVQADVMVEGRIRASLALGERAPGTTMHSDVLHAHICTLKPATALAVLALAERGRLDLSTPLTAFAPRHPGLTSARGVLADVLCHDAGLVDPGPLEVRLCPRRDRAEVVRNALVQQGEHLEAYSEWSGWFLLGEAISGAVGEPANQWIQEHLLDPLGLHDDVRMHFADGWFDENLQRIAPYWDGAGENAIPVLHDLVPHVAEDTCSPGFGGYASAHGLAVLYDHVTARLAGRATATRVALPSASFLEHALAERRGRSFDSVLQRDCDFAAGFMVNVADHWFGRSPSAHAIGHGGWMGTSFVLCDPVHDLTAVVVLNGLAGNVSDLDHLRPRIVDAIYADVLV